MSDWPEPTTFEPGPGETVLFLSRGYETIIDEVDRAKLAAFKWSTFYDGRGKLYAKAWGSYLVRPRPTFLMHRLITECVDPNLVVDHLNGNGLDNRRANLRVTCRTHNGHNRPGAVQHRGVVRVYNRFRARIRFKGETFDLGYFSNPIDAAEAYDDKARELYGPYAVTNFRLPPMPETTKETEMPF